jgi:hypothetical protein
MPPYGSRSKSGTSASNVQVLEMTIASLENIIRQQKQEVDTMKAKREEEIKENEAEIVKMKEKAGKQIKEYADKMLKRVNDHEKKMDKRSADMEKEVKETREEQTKIKERLTKIEEWNDSTHGLMEEQIAQQTQMLADRDEEIERLREMIATMWTGGGASVGRKVAE